MNKFVKYGTIAGVVVLLVGAGVSTAAVAMGADLYQVNTLMQRYNLGYSENLNAKEWDPDLDGWDLAAGSWTAEFPDLTELKVRVLGGSVTVKEDADVSAVTVYGDGGDITDTSYEENGEEKSLTVRTGKNKKIVVALPEGTYLDGADVEVNSGKFSGVNVNARNTELTVKSGALSYTQESGDSLEMEIASGAVSWTGTGTAIPRIEAECKAGALSIIMPEGIVKEDYSYRFDCVSGVIKTPFFFMEGNREERISNPETENRMELEVKSGSAAVIFR